jgi:hypothetical protein
MFGDEEPKPGILGESRSVVWRCRDRLPPFTQNGRPRFLTKDEPRFAAMRQLNASKSSFDFARIDAIEKTGRHDWYEPLRPTAAHQNLAASLSAYSRTVSAVPSNVAYWGQSRKHVLDLRFTAFDPGCVKTRLGEGRAELFSQLPSSESSYRWN